jgi:AraC-like DNA-binding protein
MSLTLAQSLIASPSAVCYVGHMTYEKDHHLKETVTPSARLLLLTEGELAYHFESQVIPYQAGQMWLVPQLTRRHWQVMSDQAQLIWVEFVHLLPMTMPVLHQPVEAQGLDTSLFERVVQCWEQLDQAAGLELASVLQTLLVRFALQVDVQENAAPSQTHPAVLKVMTWLAGQLDKPIVMDQLHEQAQLSANHFRKLFKQATDMSPTQYVQMLRLRKARYLLVTTAMSVQEVAYAVGYEDPLHFSKQYRQCWGISPKQDRASAP